ncbi:hypothetical protein, partial [Corynebacterium riegelii]|uniref:hypothetical protein n=1 Tax=Corynebacterium riegelii TaxID=156976 RepID=UPI001C60DFEB
MAIRRGKTPRNNIFSKTSPCDAPKQTMPPSKIHDTTNRHTPQHVAHTTTFHKQNALAHYRVLKQHTHTHQPTTTVSIKRSGVPAIVFLPATQTRE